MRTFKILFVCGNGIATSTAAATRCKEALDNLGINMQEEECKVDAVQGVSQTFKPDVIIPTTILAADICPEIKRFSGMPFMTGMNMEGAVTQLVDYLKSLS